MLLCESKVVTTKTLTIAGRQEPERRFPLTIGNFVPNVVMLGELLPERPVNWGYLLAAGR